MATDTPKISLNADDLTLGDLETFEDITGKSFSTLGRKSADGYMEISAKALIALAYIAKRAEDPTFTLDDARKVRPNDFALTGGNAETVPPQNADV